MKEMLSMAITSDMITRWIVLAGIIIVAGVIVFLAGRHKGKRM